MTLEEFGRAHNKDWKEIANAKVKSLENKNLIAKTVLEDEVQPFGNDIDLVVFGSNNI